MIATDTSLLFTTNLVAIAVYTDECRATLHEPGGDLQYFIEYFNQVPRFLFRIHPPSSSGETTSTFVASTGAEHGHMDILQKDVEVTREDIKRHLTKWTRKEYDNFMS